MRRGIIQVFISNIFFLVFGVLNNFILPKYLSVEAYSELKTYLLYMSYIGFASLGFADGMFLIYGGKSLDEAKKTGLGNSFVTYAWMQAGISVIAVMTGLMTHTSMTVLIGLSFFPSNVVNYLKMFCTAAGEFKILSVITGLEKTAVFFLNMIMLFFLRKNHYIWYSLVIILVFVIEIIYACGALNRKESGLLAGRFSVIEIKESVRLGFILLLGSLISSVFAGIDQFFVKYLNDTAAFAVYAFAVSMERLIVLFISPISTTLYNFFCRNKDEKEFRFLQDGIILWGSLLLTITFPLKFIIELFIGNYSDSVKLIFLLFDSEVFYCLVSSIYINLYKANKQMKKYLMQMVIMCVASAVFNFRFYSLWHSLESIALGTLVTKMIWLVICEMESKKTRFSLNANIYIMAVTAAFFVCSSINNWMIAASVYICICFAGAYLVMKQSLLRAGKEIISMLG